MAIALAPGYGVGWVDVDPDDDQPAADISLRPEQVIQGRLFDLQGRPAQGVAVSVAAIRREFVRDTGHQISLQNVYEGPSYWWARVNDLPAWSKPATTDADGRFEVHGVGRRLQAHLSIVDPRFALQTIDVETDDAPGAKSVTMALQPAKTFTGRVTYADTGKPVPQARVDISASGAGDQVTRPTYFQTDADGRFRANPSPGDLFFVTAAPPAGQLYLRARKKVEWPKGAIEQTVDLALATGRNDPRQGRRGALRPSCRRRLVNFRAQLPAAADSGDGFSESRDGSRWIVRARRGTPRRSSGCPGPQRRFRAPRNRQSRILSRSARRVAPLFPQLRRLRPDGRADLTWISASLFAVA